jgi:hypothetical protein
MINAFEALFVAFEDLDTDYTDGLYTWIPRDWWTGRQIAVFDSAWPTSSFVVGRLYVRDCALESEPTHLQIEAAPRQSKHPG